MRSSVVVIVFLILGALANLFKEVYLAGAFGTTQQMDFFRVAYSIPNFALLTLGTVIASILSGHLAKQVNTTVMTKGVLNLIHGIGFIFFIVGLLTIKQQLQFFYPGFIGNYEQLRLPMVFCWVMFLVGSFVFALRPLLNFNNYKLPASCIQFVRAVVFLLAMILLKACISEYSASALLSFAACFSSFGLLGFYIFFFFRYRKNFSFQKKSETEGLWNLTHLVFAGICYQVFYTGSRFVDRYFASSLESGFFSSLEYSYGLATALIGLMSSFLLIVLLPFVLKLKAGTVLYLSTKINVYISLFLVLVLISPFVAYFIAPYLVELLLFRGSFDINSMEMTNVVFKYQSASVIFAALSIFFAHYLISVGEKKKLIFVIITKLCLKIIIMIQFIGQMQYEIFGLSYLFLEVLFFIILALLFFISIKKVIYVSSSLRNA